MTPFEEPPFPGLADRAPERDEPDARPGTRVTA
ncbi:hypothetical protein J3A78_006445 [Streptomyces sp. PvR006]|nr:hypothetical protein [Streptomyces sp. PvR006]